jgi:putative Holliday junction resolvase
VALDYGRKRIGVAVSDPTGTIASPRGVVDRAGPALPAKLLELVADVRPRVIVVGIPFNMDGSAGEMAEEAREFAARLGAATGVPIAEWDERLTTARAEREITALGLKRSQRTKKGRSDEMAATLMLTDYLRSRAGSG